jgi:crotonobetainyl-CoA:carnitine CoA-transferase CaiB-like acyl-CoA transferase
LTAALADVRVLALEQYAAGPFGTLHLAELGADVIKIEQPVGGDVGRHVPPYRVEGDSLFFQSLNRSKRSICLDLSAPRGREVFEDLVRHSDAVYSNLRGDVPGKLRICYADLAAVNPRIVCCHLTGYGMTGPMAAQPGFDYMVQGLAGWMSITGEPDGPPAKTGLSAVDFATGITAALALMTGLHAAARDGVGGDCDISLLETALSMLNYLATWTGSAGHRPARIARSGHPTLVPFGNFRTADGWIVAGGSKEKFWQRLARALDRADLLEDPRFATFDDRLTHKDDLLEQVDAAFAERTTAHWLRRLTAAGVPCAPVNDIAAALRTPQAVARGAVFELDHPAFGSVTHVGSPVRVGTVPHRRSAAPTQGEHTLEVLTDLLGYDDPTIDRLARDGVVAGPGLGPVD